MGLGSSPKKDSSYRSVFDSTSDKLAGGTGYLVLGPSGGREEAMAAVDNIGMSGSNNDEAVVIMPQDESGVLLDDALV